MRAALDRIGIENEAGGNSRTALSRAGLDFDVSILPVQRVIAGGGVELDCPADKHFVTIRGDTREILGLVEGRYQVLQNRDVFAIADILAAEDAAVITRAGCIENGSRCFVNLEWRKERDLSVLGDIVGRRAVLQNSHDGKYAAIMRLMTLRLACVNGMVLPVPHLSFEFRIRHTESGEERLAEAGQLMRDSSRYFEGFGAVARRLAKTQVSLPHARKLTERLLPNDTTASKNKREIIVDLFDGGQQGAGHEAVKETAWGWLNAVAQYADHGVRIRRTKRGDEDVQRFKSALEGTSQRMKLDAYRLLLEDGDLGLNMN